MAYLNQGQKRLTDKLVVTKKFDSSKDGSVEFHFAWTNKGGKVWDEKMLLAVDENNELTVPFDLNEYIQHKEYCCIRRDERFTIREIDS